MLRIDRQQQTLLRLETPSLAECSITERYDLQRYICNTPEAFFEEIGERLFLIGEELKPSESVPDRIDVLALDKEGQAVVIELKRSNHKLHMLQAVAYAAMVSTWQPDDFLRHLSPAQAEALGEFLEVETSEINRKQRIILVAEAYDYSVLTSAEWLNENYGVDIICCKLAVAKDDQIEYLVCSNIFPAPELAHQAVPRGKKPGLTKPSITWSDWNDAIASLANEGMANFYRQELAAGRTNYLRKRILRFYVGGSRRWSMAARRLNAYIWQNGRFDGDVDFWRSRISKPEDVEPVKNGSCLRFYLWTADDFARFKKAADQELAGTNWTVLDASDDIEE